MSRDNGLYETDSNKYYLISKHYYDGGNLHTRSLWFYVKPNEDSLEPAFRRSAQVSVYSASEIVEFWEVALAALDNEGLERYTKDLKGVLSS